MIDEKQKIKLLSVTKELFDKNDIQYWLLDGGLLGLVRDKKLIPHESDVEIGIWYDDYDKVLDILNKFEKLGYKIKYWGEGFPSIRIFHDDFHVDLKFWIKDENKAVLIGFHHMNRFEDGLFLLKEMIDQIFHSLYLFFCKKIVHPKSDFEKLEKVKAYNLEFTIPSNYEKYLKLVYGTDWRIPHKKDPHKIWQKTNKTIQKYIIKDQKVKDLWKVRWYR